MKTVTYPLRMSEAVFRKVKKEAGRRRKKVSELFREIIDYGLPSLPLLPNDDPQTIADTWEKLGPAPEIDYCKLQARRERIKRTAQPQRSGAATKLTAENATTAETQAGRAATNGRAR